MQPRRAVKQAWRDGGRVLLRVRSLVERARTSLFTVPVVWVAFAIGLTQLVIWIDVSVGDEDLPSFTETTVDSARSILTAVSSGTIGAASVVFSLTLVAIQMSSSIYTSRVLRSFLRDRFQQHMIGILLATFTYSLLILRVVRGPLESAEDGGTAYIPRLSVFLAVVFAVAAVLALLASISHTSQSLRSSSVARQLVKELVDLIQKTFPLRDADGADAALGVSATDVMSRETVNDTSGGGPSIDPKQQEPGAVLTSSERGWVQQISLEAIRDAVTDGAAVRLDTSVGSYVYDGAPLLTVWPPPSPAELDGRMNRLRGAFAIGEERSMQQDVAFGFTMLEDIAGKALSPGVNDPNTAVEVIEQLAEPVLALLERDMHPLEMTLDGCRFSRGSVAGHDDMVIAAFNQIRHFSKDQPAVQLVLVRTLLQIGDELIRRRRENEESLDALRSMLRLVGADLAQRTADPAALAAHDLLAAASWFTPGDVSTPDRGGRPERHSRKPMSVTFGRVPYP